MNFKSDMSVYKMIKCHCNPPIKNILKVPVDLEPGQYVLSFRWDSKCTPQVWMSDVHILLIATGQLVTSIHMCLMASHIPQDHWPFSGVVIMQQSSYPLSPQQ